jgi:hypothetical protein
MDYCYSCRRTLNGALVCPGCGAYAPDIAPPPYHPEGDPAAADGHGREYAYAEYASSGRFEHTHAGATEHAHEGAAGHGTADSRQDPLADATAPAGGRSASASSQALALLSEIAPVDPGAASRAASPRAAGTAEPAASAAWGAHDPDAADGDDEDGGPGSVLGPAALAPTLHRGRAARRRQMARWQKNRRRAGAAAAVALFGGGLTMAAMPHHSGKGGPTASAVTPVTLTSLPSDNGSADPSTQQPTTGTPGGTTHTHPAGTGHSHTAGTTALPATRPDRPVTDNLATAPSPAPSSSQSGRTSYSGTTGPSSTTGTSTATTSPTTGGNSGAGTTGSGSSTANGSGSGSGTSSGSGTNTGTGSGSANTGSGSGSGSGSTAGSGSGSGSSTGSGSGSSTSTPPSTSTTTPPPQQLCLLILCLG